MFLLNVHKTVQEAENLAKTSLRWMYIDVYLVIGCSKLL